MGLYETLGEFLDPNKVKFDTIQNFKIDKKSKEDYNILCNRNFINPSHELRGFVHKRIRELKEDEANKKQNM